jgi:hypothetical protein
MNDLTKRWRIKNGAYQGREFFPSTAHHMYGGKTYIYGYVESETRRGERFIPHRIAAGRLEEINGEDV